MFTHTKKASAIILVLSLIVSMTLLAVSFLLSIARIKGSMLAMAHKTKTIVAMEAAVDHAIKAMMEDRADPARTYSTRTESIWVSEFAHIDDPDGNPFTEDGTFVRSNPSKNDLVNAYTFYDGDDMIGFPAGYNGRSSRRGIEYRPRWYNLEYLDDYYKLIEIDPSLDEADKAALRGSARYVIRYCVDIMDLGGQRKITHNWPNPPTDQTTDEWVLFQNYLCTYGRSLKSIYSISGESVLGQAFRSNDPDLATIDHMDWEQTYILADGAMCRDLGGGARGLNNTLNRSGRIAAELIFRDESFKWGNSHNDLDQMYPTLGKGRAITHAQLALRFKPGVFQHGGDDAFFWFPVGETLQDASLGGTDNISCPWRINLLTAPENTISRIIHAMSSHSKWGVYLDNPHRDSTKNNTDLFGPDYPEAFPLGVDEGRDVPIVGRRHPESAMHYNGGYNVEGTPGRYTTKYGPSDTSWLYPAYQDSYICDVIIATFAGLSYAHNTWAEKYDYDNAMSGTSTMGSHLDKWYLWQHNDTLPCYVYAAKDETDPERMVDAILREIYRILGEGYIDTSSNPAKSKNYYDHSLPGLLAGGVNHVGYGMNNPRVFQGKKARRTQLSPSCNTRAMEYLLNDFMISLFGRARPGWRDGDPLSEIAVDFNDDGYAESTVSGWYDAESRGLVWSWYWHGLGAYNKVAAGNEYMTKPGWYRFYPDGRVLRKNGSFWEPIPSESDFRKFNSVWLTGDISNPIKPFSKTGRLYIGKSQVFEVFIRAEVFNLVSKKVQAASHRSFTYKLDPNRDNDFSDSYLITQKDFTMTLPQLE